MRWRSGLAALVLLAITAWTGSIAADAQTPAPTGATGATGPTGLTGPKAIPISLIASAAEDTMSRLRAIEAASTPLATIETIQRGLPDLEQNVSAGTEETYRVLKQNRSLAALDELLDPWEMAANQAQSWLDILTRRVEGLEDLLKRLDEARARWTLTQQALAAQPTGAPAATLDRVKDTLTLIGSVRDTVEQRRGELLVLQDRAAQVLARASEMLDQVQATRRSVLGQLFVRDGLPAWSLLRQTEGWAPAGKDAGRSLGAEVPMTRLFIREHVTSLQMELALLVILGLFLRRVRRYARRWAALDDSLVPRFQPVEYPWAAAALVTLLVVAWTSPPEPRVVQAAMALAAVVPVVRLIASLAPRPLVPAVWLLGVFHIVDLVRLLMSSIPLFEQTLFLVELVALVVAIVWFRRFLHGVEERDPRQHRWSQIGRLALVVASVALVAAVLGWSRFARMLEFLLVTAGQWGLVLWALVRLSDALLAFALRVRPLRQLRAVQEYRAPLEYRLQRVVHFGAAVFWGVGLARALSVFDPLSDWLVAVLSAPVGWGAVSVTLGDLVVFVLVVWLTFMMSRGVSAVLEKDVFARVELRRGIAAAFSSLAQYTILLIGFFLGLGALGIDLTRITILAGALGVGVGFGLQNVVNNFVSGLILLFERPIQVGDSVQLGTLTGEVRRIGIRSSTVRTFEGAEVIVPNASLVSDQVTNWTLSDRMRRIDVDVGVSYDADPHQVVTLLAEVARANPGVLPEPEPLVLFLGFGDNALNFQVRAWTARFEEWVRTRSELGLAIHAALKDAGIAIPFPQRELHIVHDAPGEADGDVRLPLTR
jgi:small-conductance mechanosensitive channel